MVLDYYNLPEEPFGVTPDPRYLYLGPTHREALASLAYGIQSDRGFLALIASPGMGKTTILFHLLEKLESSARIAFLCQTLCRPQDIMRGVLRDLGVADESSDVVRLEARLNDVLLAEAKQGRKVIVVIDEAQNLDDSSLELVRLLSNFETTREKLMQIVLAGQPQLATRLASPQLLQLRQRMSMIARLQPFDREETQRYIAHRLRVVGCTGENSLFAPEAETLIAKHSGGIPRNINNICFNALSLGYVQKQKPIAANVIAEVAHDLDLDPEVPRTFWTTRRRVAARPRQKAVPAARPSRAWRKVAASGALLLLPLGLVFGNRWRVEARASRTVEPATVTAAKPVHLSAAAVEDSPVNRKSPLEVKSLPAPTSQVPALQHAAAVTQVSKSRAAGLDYVTTHDPEKLWELVRKQDTNAEVMLARLYLEGTGVPQNCPQAQVLLIAASRKGNARATELLNGNAADCAGASQENGAQP